MGDNLLEVGLIEHCAPTLAGMKTAGLFLGYPLEDVKGFIENNGRNCKSCGVFRIT